MSSTPSPDIVGKLLYKLTPLKRLIIVMSAAVLIHLTLGTYHTFGNMLPYMASYLRNYTDSSVRIEQMVWIPTFQGCFPFAMIIGGQLSLRFGPRTGAFIGCAITSLGVFLSYFTIRMSFALFVFTYGFMFGLGQGIAYVIAVTCVINWAPDRVGLVSGIVAAGFGVSSSIFAPIQTALVNPWNYAATDDGYFLEEELIKRVPEVFITMATVYAIMQAIGLIVICDPPELLSSSGIDDCSLCLGGSSSARRGRFATVHYRPVATVDTADSETLLTESTRRRTLSRDTDDSDDSIDDGLSKTSTVRNPRSLTPSEVLHSSTFYILFAALFCCSFYANMFYNLYKTFAETFIKDDFFLALCFSVGSVANAIARIGWGYLTDRTSFQMALAIACCSACALLMTMPLTRLLGQAAFFVWLTLLFICMAATHALFITAAVKCFGTKYKAVNYGFLILSTTLSGIILSLASQYLLQIIGYNWMFLITGIFPFVAFLLTSMIGNTPEGHYIC